MAENKHSCCLNTKEGTSFWMLLTMKEQLASGNEGRLTWCYYTLIASVWSPKWDFINERTPAVFWGTFTSVTCAQQQEGRSSAMALLQQLCGTQQVSVHWIYDVKFQSWSWTPSPPLLWKLIHMNSWLIIKGSAISIQSPSRGCHGSEGRNLLRATGEPNWICGVSVYECVSTSSVHQKHNVLEISGQK